MCQVGWDHLVYPGVTTSVPKSEGVARSKFKIAVVGETELNLPAQFRILNARPFPEDSMTWCDARSFLDQSGNATGSS